MRTTTLDELQADILLALLAELETIGGRSSPLPSWTGYSSFGIPWSYVAAGLADLTPPCRRAVSRVLLRLENEGLVETAAWGCSDRMTHIRPTEKLLARALELTDNQADLNLMARAIDGTDWGIALADVARRLANGVPA